MKMIRCSPTEIASGKEKPTSNPVDSEEAIVVRISQTDGSPLTPSQMLPSQLRHAKKGMTICLNA